MSAANSRCTFASRVVPLSVLVSTLILAFAAPALAATKAVDPNAKPNNTVKRLPNTVQSVAPAPGTPRILLVDDDVSDNNNIPGDTRLSLSDTVFRKLVSDAVGGNAASWAIETVKTNANGPAIDKLRPYSLIIWYTGASYGGNPDNTSVLSIEDEKTVRRYLQETGGAVILVSPGYASKVLEQGSTWEASSWPFLNEVLGIRGGKGLAQRFEPGTVTSAQGTQFHVGKGGSVESQFSAVNPGSATVVFSSALDAMKNNGQPTTVATAFPYGKGRIIYVGFTFENLSDADLKPAFNTLLAATGLQQNSSATPSAALVKIKPQAISVSGSGHESLNIPPSNTRTNKAPVKSIGIPVTIYVIYTALSTPSSVTCTASVPTALCNTLASSFSTTNSTSASLIFNLDSAQLAVNGSYDVSSSLSGTIWDNYRASQNTSALTAIAIVQGGLVSGLNVGYSFSQEGTLIEYANSGNSGAYNGVTTITFPGSTGSVSVAYDGTYDMVQPSPEP